ncbi:MAG TPA: pirin family protein [bacterium]|nr:pirin family protein [bacterium]
MKKIVEIRKNNQGHWVGDGFPVRTLFSYDDRPELTSPFLLLDYAGPAEFKPSDHRRGVGEHPHRGFETVTVVYQGEVVHRDSAGNGGRVGPGDVQWMTAASGVVHEEKHGDDLTRNGGMLEMVQLWVNLPAKDKMSPPRYQDILDKQIPVVDLDAGAGSVRVIAGEWKGNKGPAKTFTPINLWDLHLSGPRAVTLVLPEGHTAAVLVRKGAVTVAGKSTGEGELALLGRDGAELVLEAHGGEADALLMSGLPIDEPVVGYGPFVMNTGEEIRQAAHDYHDGKMGHL